MADGTEHRIKIKADAREGKQGLREIQQASSQLERELTQLVRQQIKLNKELSDVKKGTAEYKKLKDELRGVASTARDAERLLGQMGRAASRAEREAARAARQMGGGGAQPGVGGQRQQGFVAGLAQGSGLMQFLPTGPSMVPRMAGAAVGGAFRRGAGAASAPFLSPGIGGLTQSLGSIPLVGGMAAGALSAGQGYYQKAAAFSQGRLQNMFFAGPNAGQFASTAPADAAERIAAARSNLGRVGRDVPYADITKRASSLKGEIGSAISPMGLAGLPLGPGAGSLTDAQRRSKARSQLESERARNIAEAKKAIEKEEAAAKTGYTKSGLGGVRLGTSLGFSPTQTQAMKGQFFGARGGLATPGALGEFQESMIAQRGFGISAQAAGAFGRMGIAGGGGSQMQGGLMQTMAAAVSQGLRGAQVSQYLQALVGLGQAAESRGVKVRKQGFERSTALLKGVGFKGLQASRVASGLNQGAMDLSERGVSSPMDMIRLRAAGFTPDQGAEGYATAINRLEGGFDEGMMENLLSEFAEGASSFGGPEMQAMALRRVMKESNAPIGAKQAKGLLKSFRSGGMNSDTRSRIQEIVSQQESGKYRKDLASGITRRAGKIGGVAIQRAGQEAEEIAAGQKLAPLFLDLNRVVIGNVRNLSNFRDALHGVTKWMLKATQMVDQSTKGGLEGMAEGAAEFFGVGAR